MTSKWLSDLDLGWVVGFLEGEGSFSASVKYRAVKICASQVQEEPISKLLFLLGGTKHFIVAKKSNPNPFWYWNIQGRPALFLMEKFKPYMSAKRQKEIEICFEKWNSWPHRKTKTKNAIFMD